MLSTTQIIKLLKYSRDVKKTLDALFSRRPWTWAEQERAVSLCSLRRELSAWLISGLRRHICHDFFQCPFSNDSPTICWEEEQISWICAKLLPVLLQIAGFLILYIECWLTLSFILSFEDWVYRGWPDSSKNHSDSSFFCFVFNCSQIHIT